MTKKYEYTTTTDGITYAFEIKPEVPGWTPEQFRAAKRYLTLAYVAVSTIGALLGIFIAILLKGQP